MTPLFNSGPLEERLRLLQSAYTVNLPEELASALCIWLVKDPEEARMVSAMVATEGTPGSVLNDLFVTISGAGAGGVNFVRDCLRDFQQTLAENANDLQEAGLPEERWKVVPAVSSFSELLAFVSSTFQQLPGLNTRTTLFLSPSSINDQTNYVSMLEYALEEGLPENFILMVTAYEGEFLLERFRTKSPEKTVIIPANLNMADAVKEVVATGDQKKPTVQFHQLYVEMSEYGAKGAFEKMQASGAKALRIAEQMPGWEHMIVTLFSAQGSMLLTRKSQREEALKCFEKARKVAQQMLALEQDSAATVLHQALSFEALGLYHLKRYRLAGDTYLKAVAAAEEEDLAFGRFESYRMASHAYTLAGDYQAAWANGEEGLNLAEKLDPEFVPYTTIYQLGEALLELAEQLNKRAEITNISQRISNLVGPDWEEHLEKNR